MTPTRPQRRAIAAIEWYQRLVAGRPSPCRFTPSCSEYARESFQVHGTTRGSLLTLRRLLRCRPFGPSGFDPVPDPPGRESGVERMLDLNPTYSPTSESTLEDR